MGAALPSFSRKGRRKKSHHLSSLSLVLLGRDQLTQEQEEMRGNSREVQEERAWVKRGAGALSLLMCRVIMYWQLFAD